MHPEIAATFKQALQEAIPIVREQLAICAEPFFICKRKIGEPNSSAWHGTTIQSPNWDRIALATMSKIFNIAKSFGEALNKHWPNFGQPVTLGRVTRLYGHGGQMEIMNAALRLLYERHNTLDLQEKDITDVVAEFERFVDGNRIPVAYHAHLVNFEMSCSHIDLADSVTIRRLTDAELTDINGGFRGMQPFLNQKRGDCALSCYQEEEQDFANGIPRGRGSSDAAQPSHSVLTQIARGNRIVGDKFDRAVTALRTFKAGYVGYEKICGTAMTFCPLNVGEYGHSDLFIPLGHYSISESEATVLAGHSKAMHAVRDSAMQMACRRLADAETRLHDEDRLVDAVIGLEAWLLTDGNRSELSYRFALNYSTLGTTPAERYELYQRARTLYSLRSSIAHGGEPATSSQPLSDEAKSACEMLRAVILRFLSVASTKLPKDYWLNRVLGVSQ